MNSDSGSSSNSQMRILQRSDLPDRWATCLFALSINFMKNAVSRFAGRFLLLLYQRDFQGSYPASSQESYPEKNSKVLHILELVPEHQAWTFSHTGKYLAYSRTPFPAMISSYIRWQTVRQISASDLPIEDGDV